MGTATDYPIHSKPGEPPWELATLYSPQGSWTLNEYLNLNTNRLIEFNKGTLEFLTMPTEEHQDIVAYLYELMKAFVLAGNLGKVNFAPLRVQIAEDKVREPDIVFMLKEHDHRRGNRAWQGADLVMEVVSGNPEDHQRDYEDKRKEYAGAGIPEYWIVDPNEKLITVLKLEGGKYVTHAKAAEGETAGSALLEGFSVEATKVFHRD